MLLSLFDTVFFVLLVVYNDSGRKNDMTAFAREGKVRSGNEACVARPARRFKNTGHSQYNKCVSTGTEWTFLGTNYCIYLIRVQEVEEF